MAAPDIVFALTGGIERNSRALKQLRVFAKMGLQVHVLALGKEAKTSTLPSGATVQVLLNPPGRGPRFFARVHRLFRDVASQLPALAYHASDLYTLPPLARAATTHKAKLIYDARECYPHVAATVGRPWVRWFWQLVEQKMVRKADAVFTVSTSIAQHMAQQYGIRPPDVLYNVPEKQPVHPSNGLREHLGLSTDRVVVLHQGQMRKHRGCHLLVDAFQDVQDASLVFLGYGPLKPQLMDQVRSFGLTDCVHFVDAVPPSQLLPLTASADIGVTLLEDVCLNHRYALPNKLFEYLMAELPVLASDLPEVRKVVVPHDVGRVVNPTERSQLVQVLNDMIQDEGARKRWRTHTPRIFATFSWEDASKHLQNTYHSLLA